MADDDGSRCASQTVQPIGSSLYAFYRKQWWCYEKMVHHFKCCHALFNGLALLLVAAGMIVGPILENSTLVACLAAVVTVVKGWNDFKRYQSKLEMSRFALNTYDKALLDLKMHVNDMDRFLLKMQVLDETIIDLTPPLPKRWLQEYYHHFVYHEEGCRLEKDKKLDADSLIHSKLWLSEENERDENSLDDHEKDNKEVDGGKT